MGDDVKERGTIFTPTDIAKYMVSFIDNRRPKRILEPCCGTGAILKYIHPKHETVSMDINSDYVASARSANPSASVIVKDFVDYDTTAKFDYVICNPPYVKIQNMSPETLAKLRSDYPEFIVGNTNLYVYFMLKAFDLLKDGGKAVFIVPNTLLHNRSLSRIYDHFFGNGYVHTLIDFKEKQIFADASTYTCIVVFTRKANKTYRYANDIGLSWKTVENVKRLPSTSKVHLRIGIMTLCDVVFIIKDWKQSVGGRTIEFVKYGVTYTIESAACRDILKVSKKQMHKIVYPYLDCGVIDGEFLNRYPKCAVYLRKFKDLLDNRDGGKGDYPKWYAFGRTQSLTEHDGDSDGSRWFLPAVVRNIRDSLFKSAASLYYSGYMVDGSIADLKKNEETILARANHRAGGWYAITNYSLR